jgi:D-beta-D-heptose 7-phosphate kinase/D-beta-D-heptose 1-phosphate adenosyltransferase
VIVKISDPSSLSNSKQETKRGTGNEGSDIARTVLALQKSRVFVVGDLILDSYVQGNVERISPEAPVPVVQVRSRHDVLGGAGNVAANIRALGGAVTLCGRIALDAAGDSFIGIAESCAIDVSAILRAEGVPTIRKTRVLSGSQQLVRLDDERIESLTLDQEKQIILHFERFCNLKGSLKEGIPDNTQKLSKALVLSDYDKGVLTPSLIRRLIAISIANEIAIVVDPKKRNVEVYQGCTVIKPNRAEALSMIGHGFAPNNLEDVSNVIETIRTRSGAKNVVLSLSSEGVACGGSDVAQSLQHYPTSVLKVADVSGAGDTMVAVLAMGLASGIPLARVTELGNVAAGLVCAKLGTATVSAAELVQGYHLAQGHHVYEKIIDGDTAASLAQHLRSEGHTVVFTNGCFDLIHPGHIQTLVGAKQKGHFLFVGLNDDASVRRLKGPTRPIQDEQSRATVLAGLACVDFVILFAEDTPLDLIRAIRPDCLVKGGDYQVVDQIVGAPDVLSWGGRVETVTLVPHQSTTRMIERSGGGI